MALQGVQVYSGPSFYEPVRRRRSFAIQKNPTMLLPSPLDGVNRGILDVLVATFTLVVLK